jgi:hypothetical protein
MEAHVIGFNMWVKAVEKAGTFDAEAVIDAMIGVAVPNLTGGISTMMPNHHITKPVLIGEIQADGQINTVWQTSGLVVGDEWSDYLEGSKDLIADWRKADDDCCAEVIGTTPTGVGALALAGIALNGDETRTIRQNLITQTKETSWGLSAQLDAELDAAKRSLDEGGRGPVRPQALVPGSSIDRSPVANRISG